MMRRLQQKHIEIKYREQSLHKYSLCYCKYLIMPLLFLFFLSLPKRGILKVTELKSIDFNILYGTAKIDSCICSTSLVTVRHDNVLQ